MSKLGDLYTQSKLAAITGAGYFAIRSPRRTLKVVGALTRHYLLTQLRDAGVATKLIWRNLAKPVLVEDAAVLSGAARMQWANLQALGPVFGSTIFLTTGGGIAQNINQVTEWLGIALPGDPGNIAD